MTDDRTGSWTTNTKGRDRVRQVVELLDGPTPVQQIAERAEVARGTAADELRRLQRDDWVVETTVDGAKAYDLNPVRLLFDQITELIDQHTREELEQQLTEYKAREESLEAKYEVSSIDQLRDRLATADLSADELTEYRNVVDTWEALEAEISLRKHALQLYGNVTELSTPGTNAADSPSG